MNTWSNLLKLKEGGKKTGHWIILYFNFQTAAQCWEDASVSMFTSKDHVKESHAKEIQSSVPTNTNRLSVGQRSSHQSIGPLVAGQVGFIMTSLTETPRSLPKLPRSVFFIVCPTPEVSRDVLLQSVQSQQTQCLKKTSRSNCRLAKKRIGSKTSMAL